MALLRMFNVSADPLTVEVLASSPALLSKLATVLARLQSIGNIKINVLLADRRLPEATRIILIHDVGLPLYPSIDTSGKLYLILPSSKNEELPALLSEKAYSISGELPLTTLVSGLTPSEVEKLPQLQRLVNMVKEIINTFEPAEIMGESITGTLSFYVRNGRVIYPRVLTRDNKIIVEEKNKLTIIDRDGREIEVIFRGRCGGGRRRRRLILMRKVSDVIREIVRELQQSHNVRDVVRSVLARYVVKS